MPVVYDGGKKARQEEPSDFQPGRSYGPIWGIDLGHEEFQGRDYVEKCSLAGLFRPRVCCKQSPGPWQTDIANMVSEPDCFTSFLFTHTK